jgi:hypothetical protein
VAVAVVVAARGARDARAGRLGVVLDPKSPKGARGAREARAGRLGVVLDPKSPKGARGVREARAGRRGGVSAPKSPNELIAAVGVVVAVAGVAAGGEEFPCAAAGRNLGRARDQKRCRNQGKPLRTEAARKQRR